MSTPQPPSVATPENCDYSERLIALGALQILLGCLCGLVAAFTALRLLHWTPEAQKAGPPAFNDLAYSLPPAVAFIWLGKGMIAARRWAWTLTVVSSWIWLVLGAGSFLVVELSVEPRTLGDLARQGKMPAQMVMTMRLIFGVVLAFVYIGLPGLLLLFSHHDSVRATCVRRDPRVPWTDRCPMPVLALVLLLVFWAVSGPLKAAFKFFVVPLFGIVFSGWAGALVLALMAIILAGLAWGLYRLRMAAWWGTLLLGVAGSLNTAITDRADFAEIYKRQGLSADQLEMFRKTGLLEVMPQWGLWIGLIDGVACVAYMLVVRRYFVKTSL